MNLDVPRVEELGVDEQERLHELEAVMEHIDHLSVAVKGAALLEIRESRLYRDNYDTFEAYCRERWGFQASRARQLIGAVEVARSLEGVTNVTVANEGQARALGKYPDELRPEIIQRAKQVSDETGKPVTAGLIEGVGRVLQEADATGHVDLGDGTSTPVDAAITAEAYEHTQRQKQHIRDHYDEHDAQGHVTPEAQARRDHLNVLSADSVEWYTPPEYVDAAREVMGGIDLDPASNTTAQEIIQAATFYTKDTNGLANDWHGRVWLNPPYGKACAEFVAKAIHHYDEGDIDQAILLVNSNSNETEWFQPLWNHTLCFSRGRINYYTTDGELKSGSTHGSVFVYLGRHWERFAETFAAFGNVVRRIA